MRSIRLDVPIACGVLTLAALCADASRAAADPPAAAADAATSHARGEERGKASFYSQRLAGHRTASGERYDPDALTAAHRSLPLGTKVRVVNPKNDRSVVVTVNDRGPVSKSRVMDVSAAAADRLGMRRAGVTHVHTEVVGRPDDRKGD